MTTITSRDLNQDAGRAKRAALKGPVFITDRGRPAHVLLSIEEYRRLTGKGRSVLDSLAQRDGGDFDIEFPRSRELSRPVEFD